MKINRMQKIEEYIKQVGNVTNEELCAEFRISTQTLRRDLKILEEAEKVDKVYGGVIWKNKLLLNSVQTIVDREHAYQKEKKYIGELSARLVENNNVIYIDSGTTACQIVPHLSHHKNITIITHSLLVVNMASKVGNCDCICIGGELKKDTLSFSIDTTDHIYNCDLAFIATVGICSEGLTNTDVIEGKIKQYIMKLSERVYVVTDHTKFANKGFYHFANLEDLAGVVTDQRPSDKFVNACNKLGVQVIVD